MGVMGNAIGYESDGFGWAMEQAALLREGRLSEIDAENIAEEIESLGKSLRSELVNRLAIVLTHLLKWQYQPFYRGRSWRLTLEEQRERLIDHIAANPSLKPFVPEAVETAYRYGRKGALRETELSDDTFPETCPWSPHEVLSETFYPE